MGEIFHLEGSPRYARLRAHYGAHELAKARRKRARRRYGFQSACGALFIFVLVIAYYAIPEVPNVRQVAHHAQTIFQHEPRSSVAVNQKFAFCGRYNRDDCIIDGDTIRFRGEKIRFEDFDTPETWKPRCASEAARGREAKFRLQQLMNQGPFDLVTDSSRNRGYYGRLLRRIERGGQSFGDILVAEGLAHVWDGARHSWCG